MLRLLAIPSLIVVFAAGCASSGGQDPAPQDRPVLVDNGSMYTTNGATGTATAFKAPAAQVWTALSAAYVALNIPLAVNDPANHRMGNTNFYRSGSLNGQSLARFADCGNGPNGPRANTSRIYFSVISTLTVVDATHTTVATIVTPVAVDMSGTTNDRLNCGSTGQLESMLYGIVANHLKG